MRAWKYLIVFTLALLPAVAAFAGDGITDWEATGQNALHELHVDAAVEFTVGSPAWKALTMAIHGRMPAGTHRPVAYARIGGKPHALFRYMRGYMNGIVASPEHDLLAVELESGSIYPREIDAPKRIGAVVDASFGPKLHVSSPGAYRLLGRKAAEDVRTRERQVADQALAEDRRQRQEVAERQRPLKRQIGARLCQTVGAYRYVAFTEAVSPDNGKIKLYVVGTAGIRPGDFAPHYVWDHPDRWDVCD